MKTKTMNSTFGLWFGTSAILLTALTLPHSSWARGDGRGINGPDLSGQALPIEVDRQVPDWEVRRTQEACAKETARVLLVQIYGEKEIESQEFWKAELLTYVTSSRFYAAYAKESDSNRILSFVDLTDTSLYVLPRGSTCYRAGCYTDSVQLKRHPEAPLAIPSLKYETFAADYVYGELGEEISHRIYVRNLRIENANQAPITGFRNAKTNKEVAISIDLRPYVQCLVDGIQSGKYAHQ
ncbi:MAG: hypothetical protein NDJ89_03410 [Oligoflexia bacterium]|nr:hypothetical protein [Oligoflexia bacterium]